QNPKAPVERLEENRRTGRTARRLFNRRRARRLRRRDRGGRRRRDDGNRNRRFGLRARQRRIRRLRFLDRRRSGGRRGRRGDDDGGYSGLDLGDGRRRLHARRGRCGLRGQRFRRYLGQGRHAHVEARIVLPRGDAISLVGFLER